MLDRCLAELGGTGACLTDLAQPGALPIGRTRSRLTAEARRGRPGQPSVVSRGAGGRVGYSVSDPEVGSELARPCSPWMNSGSSMRLPAWSNRSRVVPGWPGYSVSALATVGEP